MNLRHREIELKIWYPIESGSASHQCRRISRPCIVIPSSLTVADEYWYDRNDLENWHQISEGRSWNHSWKIPWHNEFWCCSDNQRSEGLSSWTLDRKTLNPICCSWFSFPPSAWRFVETCSRTDTEQRRKIPSDKSGSCKEKMNQWNCSETGYVRKCQVNFAGVSNKILQNVSQSIIQLLFIIFWTQWIWSKNITQSQKLQINLCSAWRKVLSENCWKTVNSDRLT